MTSLYIHIPFCLKKCLYCSFNSSVGNSRLFGDYQEALKTELAAVAGLANSRGHVLESIFIGGGTPTCLPLNALVDIITTVLGDFAISAEVEISVEANPGTVDRSYFAGLHQAGVNRISLGVQSFDDNLLSKLGRLHTSSDAVCAVNDAKEAGFGNINLDLMYGLPGQSPLQWRNSLEQAVALSPQHLSLYQLMVENQTPIFVKLRSGELQLPREEEVDRMDELTWRICSVAGYDRYEISNYSLGGFECVHNIRYWHNDDYYAVGASAVSFLGGIRQKRVADPIQYIQSVTDRGELIAESEQLSREESFRETVIMGLRLVEGVCLEQLQKKYNMDPLTHYGELLSALVAKGLVELGPTHFRISNKGWPFSNRIMAELV